MQSQAGLPCFSHFRILSVEKESIINQLRDDTALFLKDVSQIPVPVDIISIFSRSFSPNIDEWKVLSFKNCTTLSVYNIPLKDTDLKIDFTLQLTLKNYP